MYKRQALGQCKVTCSPISGILGVDLACTFCFPPSCSRMNRHCTDPKTYLKVLLGSVNLPFRKLDRTRQNTLEKLCSLRRLQTPTHCSATRINMLGDMWVDQAFQSSFCQKIGMLESECMLCLHPEVRRNGETEQTQIISALLGYCCPLYTTDSAHVLTPLV